MKDETRGSLPLRVFLHEVVLRDGIQNEPTLVATDRKIELVNGLIRSGLGRIELSSFVNPRCGSALGPGGTSAGSSFFGPRSRGKKPGACGPLPGAPRGDLRVRQ